MKFTRSELSLLYIMNYDMPASFSFFFKLLYVQFLFVNSIPTHRHDNFCYSKTFWKVWIKIFYIQKHGSICGWVWMCLNIYHAYITKWITLTKMSHRLSGCMCTWYVTCNLLHCTECNLRVQISEFSRSFHSHITCNA